MPVDLAQLKSVNEVVRDRIIRHAVLLEQYKTEQVRKIISFFNRDLEPDLLEKLTKYAGKTLTENRLRIMRQSMKDVMAAGYLRMRKDLEPDLIDLGKSQGKWDAAVIEKALPVKLSLATLSVPTIREMVVNRPIDGRLVREWLEELGQAQAIKVNRQIMIGVAEGEGIDEIVRRIRGTAKNRYRDGILARSRREIESVVRTSVSGVVNNVRQGTYRANADVVKAVQWVATLDSHTCEVCAAYDGQVYGLMDGPRPPQHIGCRCTTVPVCKSWKELGFDFKEMPASERAAMNGRVADKVTYGQWLKGQSRQTQELVLGKGKAQLFRSGKVAIRDFVDDRGRVLTLKELEALD